MHTAQALPPHRTLSLCCCQIKAWKAGHKGNCVAATRADTTAAKPTADQMHVLKILAQLYGAADWRGVAAQERAARAVAAAVRDFDAGHCCVGLRHPRHCVSVAGELLQGHRVPHAGPGDCKGGGRPGGGGQGSNLGTYHTHLNDVKAVAYFEANHALATSLKLAHMQSHAAMNMGVAPRPSGPRSSPGPCYWCWPSSWTA